MSITEELREWWVRKFPVMDKELHEDFTAIANRIDAEHEKACNESWMRDHDAWAAIDRRKEMAEHGWILLPVDADGEVWHVGDLAIGFVNQNNPKEVERMLWYGPDSGWQLETDNIIFPCPEHVRHHHAPTVEDVLREFADIVRKERVELATISEDTIAEYATKLRLAGDEK